MAGSADHSSRRQRPADLGGCGSGRRQQRDVNIQRANLFHTRMRIKAFDLDAGIFKSHNKRLSHAEQQEIARRIEMEIAEIFKGGR